MLESKPFNAVQSPIEPGLTLLEAGAGTGKTYSLVRIIARELVEKSIPLDQILTVTFTRAATAEIKGRLHELLSEILTHLKKPPVEDLNDLARQWINQGEEFRQQAIRTLSLSLATFDSVPIFTIDGFFQKLLKEYAFESQVLFSVELDTNENTLIDTALRDYWRQRVYPMNQEELSAFNSEVSFDDATRFLVNVLQSGEICFDPAYEQSIGDMLEDYSQHWQKFVGLLEKHRVGLTKFLANPPAGISKRPAPFKKGSDVGFFAAIDAVLQTPAKVKTSLGPIGSISARLLFAEKAFNKGKFIDLSDHDLAELFKAVEQLELAAPTHMKSAYLGDIFTFVSEKLQSLKSEKNVQSYNDVTQTLANLVESGTKPGELMKSAIKANYQAVLIDEFQDTSPQQCAVFLNLFKHVDRYFHIIGDPKQSIYRFRGADVFSYIKARKQAEHRYTLLTNYRSSPRMIHAVNRLFSMSDDPFLVDNEIEFHAAAWPDQQSAIPPQGNASAALHWHGLHPDLKNKDNFYGAINQSICCEVVKLLDTDWQEIAPGSNRTGKVQPSDIAVLVAGAKEAAPLTKELSKFQIPVATNTKSSLMNSGEAEEVLTILTALLEPWRSSCLRAALLTPAMGSGAIMQDSKEFTKVTNYAAELHECWNTRGLMPMMLQCVEKFDVRSTLLSLSQGKRRITNFMHLIELLDAKARQQKFTPSATLQWLEMAIQGTVVDMDSAVLELRISTDDDALMILTQHSSKGLEFPIVFTLPSCHRSFSRLKPDLAYHQPETFRTMLAPFGDNSGDVYDIRVQEACADRARLAYVAVTRAQYLCHYYYIPEEVKRPTEHAVFQMLGEPNSEDFEQLAESSSGCVEYHEILDADQFKDSFEKLKSTRTKTGEDLLNTASKGDDVSSLRVRSSEQIVIHRNQRTTSFSGITQASHDLSHGFHDVDSQADAIVPAPDTGFWKKLQAGASLGSAFHEILEDVDFKDPYNLPALVREKLTAYSPWRDTPEDTALDALIGEVTGSMLQLLDHPLSSESSTRLRDISLSNRLTEPEFLLSGSNFNIHSLCEVIANDPPPELPPHYISLLQHMPKSQFDGFLVGFIDLIFYQDGRYHLLDWKTNRIPSNSTEGMATVMADHHYFLQYHLYTLALDRFLSQRLGDSYDADLHLGDVYYVFFRGVDSTIPGSGVYSDRLTAERLEALRTCYLSHPLTH